MNNLNRQIKFQRTQRMVNEIPVNRDADFGIIFEKNRHLNLAKKMLKIKNDDIDFYSGERSFGVKATSVGASEVRRQK